MVVPGPPTSVPRTRPGVAQHRGAREVAVVEDERIGRRRLVTPQPDLGRELHVAAGGPGLRDAEPCRQVGDAGAGQHRVGVERAHTVGEVPGAGDGGQLPAVGRRVQVGLVRGLVGAPRVGGGLGSQRRDPVVAETGEVLVLVVDVEHPVADPRVEVVAATCCPRLDPELVVLAVPVDRQVTREQAARVRAHRRFADGEDSVCGNANEVRPGAEIVDDPLDGDDRAPARSQRTPRTLQERRMERDVPLPVRDRGVQQRDVRVQRGEQPDFAEGRRDARRSRRSLPSTSRRSSG